MRPMRQAFWDHQDIHDFTARKIFEIGPFADVTANQRRMAKSVNFGLLYGMSDFGLAQRLEIERGEARKITEAYFARFPGVRGYIDRCLEEGRERGYVQTLLGRAPLHARSALEESHAALGRGTRSNERAASGQRRGSDEARDWCASIAGWPNSGTT